jgi:hypothetical protein
MVRLCLFRIRRVNFYSQPFTKLFFHFPGYAYSLFAGNSGGISTVENKQLRHVNPPFLQDDQWVRIKKQLTQKKIFVNGFLSQIRRSVHENRVIDCGKRRSFWR